MLERSPTPSPQGKAKAFDKLAAFYDACAQVEIDEYRDYDKAGTEMMGVFFQPAEIGWVSTENGLINKMWYPVKKQRNLAGSMDIPIYQIPTDCSKNQCMRFLSCSQAINGTVSKP